MKKVLILQNEISAYNVSTFNIIAEKYDLTVAYNTKDKSNIECKFKKQKLETIQLGSIQWIKGVKKISNKYDAVIFLPNLHIISYCLLPFIKHSFKLITWSIGFRVSYIHPYITNRKHVFLDYLFKKILSACDANIFYMNKSREFWHNTNLRMDNVFEAINTTIVEKIEFVPEQKKDFLFVGTLYKGKGLDLLLKAYKAVIGQCDTDIKLRIVGAGSELESLKCYVQENGMQDWVIFHGAIYDEKEIAPIFQKSLLCFSPTQAGLSVPKSMGYGVPFVSRKDAITGGELYHITNYENGIIYDEDADLHTIMVDAIKNRDKYINMGKRAMEYYYNHATVKHMAQGAINAIEFALNH